MPPAIDASADNEIEIIPRRSSLVSSSDEDFQLKSPTSEDNQPDSDEKSLVKSEQGRPSPVKTKKDEAMEDESILPTEPETQTKDKSPIILNDNEIDKMITEHGNLLESDDLILESEEDKQNATDIITDEIMYEMILDSPLPNGNILAAVLLGGMPLSSTTFPEINDGRLEKGPLTRYDTHDPHDPNQPAAP